MSVTKTQSIKAFLTAFAPLDLAERYNHDMEVQVTIAKDNGERITGDFKGKQWHAYTDGVQTWKPIRIPINGNISPEFTDNPMSFDLKDHAEGIGMTGWDWKNKVSRWVAFDFDAIVGHSDRHAKKLTDTQLNEIRNHIKNVPWVELRKSTGGKGLHLYIFLNSITTNTRNEHIAAARSILAQLSAHVGYDFVHKVDVLGGNIWVWHRKLASTNGEGLKLIKAHTELATVPQNWRDYINVVSGQRSKNLPRYIDEQKSLHYDIEDIFNQLTGQRVRISLDDDHKKIYNWLVERYPSATWWDSEHHLMVTHTALLKECHDALSLKGQFDTLAKGEDRGNDINCWMFPLPKGTWVVRRYTLGVQEHSLWEQDGSGWTKIVYNQAPDFNIACKSYEGLEEPTGGYQFASSEQAQKAAVLLGANLDLPNHVLGKRTRMKIHKSGRLIVEIDRDSDTPPIQGWLVSKSKLTKMFSINNPTPLHTEEQLVSLDPMIRHLITESGENLGWVMKSDNEWHEEPFLHINTFVKSLGMPTKETLSVLGNLINQPWTVVNIPFSAEYPADRRWNRNAVQLVYRPSQNDELNYPTWMMILNHLGNGLNDAIKQHDWCKKNNIVAGVDYLKIWIASLFQCPQEPLPFLFLYGTQNCGKSIFHEALSLLITHGYCRADQALINGSGFNGELEGAILAVVEETDLRKNIQAYNRIKDWVTAIKLPIHKKQRQPYLVNNLTHWVMTSNTHLSCPITIGDSRITMIHVDDLHQESIIPKKDLLIRLKEEAADFVAEILNLEIPKSNDRLNVPIIITEGKILTEISNQTLLELFCSEECHYTPGHVIKFSDFVERFKEWLEPNMVSYWGKMRVSRELPLPFIKGKLPREQGQIYVANISFIKVEEKDYKEKFFLSEGFLCNGKRKSISSESINSEEQGKNDA